MIMINGKVVKDHPNNIFIGNKLIKIVANGYTWIAPDIVKIGDTVVLPVADWLRDVKGDTWEGEVTALESDYDGSCRSIIGIKS